MMGEAASGALSTRAPLAAQRDEVARADEILVALLEQYETRIYSFVFMKLRDRDGASDVTQDTFVRAYEHLRRGREVTAGWLYTVARNRIMDGFRRGSKTCCCGENIAWEAAPAVPIDLCMSVRAAFKQVEPGDREVLYLFAVAGFRTDEIGAMLGIRGSAVRQRLSRARQRFRCIYEGKNL